MNALAVIFLVLFILALAIGSVLFAMVLKLGGRSGVYGSEYHGILHIGEFDGKTNYNFEILIPFEEMEQKGNLIIKVDNRRRNGDIQQAVSNQ